MYGLGVCPLFLCLGVFVYEFGVLVIVSAFVDLCKCMYV